VRRPRLVGGNKRKKKEGGNVKGASQNIFTFESWKKKEGVNHHGFRAPRKRKKKWKLTESDVVALTTSAKEGVARAGRASQQKRGEERRSNGKKQLEFTVALVRKGRKRKKVSGES